MAQNEQEPEWLLEGILLSDGTTMLAGAPGAYKTWIALYIALHIAIGKPLFGMDTKQASVIYIDEENSIALLRERIKKIAGNWSQQEQDLVSRNFHIAYNARGVLENNYSPYLEKHIMEHGIKLIVLDTFRKGFRGDENSSNDVSNFFHNVIDDAKRKYGVSWLLLHHLGKKQNTKEMESARGSSAINGGLDVQMNIQDCGEGRITLHQTKTRSEKKAEPMDLQIEEDEDDTSLAFVLTDASKRRRSVNEEVAEEIIRRCQLQGTEYAFQKSTMDKQLLGSFSRSAVKTALKLLLRRGKLSSPRMGHYVWKSEVQKPSLPSSSPPNTDEVEKNTDASPPVGKKISPKVPDKGKFLFQKSLLRRWSTNE